MHFLEDPSDMTPEQRLTEIAMILASGVRRIRSIDTMLGPQESPRTGHKGLDVSRRVTRPCGEGLTDGDPKEDEHDGNGNLKLTHVGKKN